MVYFNQTLHMYACQNYLTTGMHKKPFWMDEALLSNSSVGRDQLGEMIITLEPHGIFGSNFAYLF